MSMETSILVSRLPVDVSADEMKDYFGKFGDIVSVKIIDPQLYCYSASQYEDKHTQTAIIEFAACVDRQTIIATLNHQPFPTQSELLMRVSLLEDIQKENKLFVGMIPEGTTEDELRRLFEQYGEVKEVVIIKSGDAVTKGYGFCRYTTRKGALSAIQGMNGKTFLHKASVSLVIKFADTPNQKQVRLQKQKTWKAVNLFHQPKTDTSLASYHPHNISYELEMLQELPKLSFSLDWEDPVFKASDSASQCWVDFAQLSQSHKLVELMCTKEEILKEENYRNYAVSSCSTCIHIFNFPETISAEGMYQKCSTLGRINDIVILVRFPYTYGRIECPSFQCMANIYNSLCNPITIDWILSSN
ncbi:hypothetical protein WA538_005404 [Blastocystis sp. DL]